MATYDLEEQEQISALQTWWNQHGNLVVAFWYPTDWTSFSVDYIRVEVPGPTPDKLKPRIKDTAMILWKR